MVKRFQRGVIKVLPICLLLLILAGCQTSKEFSFEQIDPEFGLKSVKLPHGWEIYSVTQSLIRENNQDITKEKLEYTNIPERLMIEIGKKSPENTVDLEEIQKLETENYNYIRTLYLVSHDSFYGSLDVYQVPKHLKNTEFEVHDILQNELIKFTVKEKDVFKVIHDSQTAPPNFLWLSDDRKLVFQLLINDEFTEEEQITILEQFH